VVLLGPSHFVPFRGLALPSVSAFATPLGDVPLVAGAAERLADLPQVIVSDRPHGREHSLEVELPFLQVVLDRFELVPLSVGEAEPDEVAAVLGRSRAARRCSSLDRPVAPDCASARRATGHRGCDRRADEPDRRLTPAAPPLPAPGRAGGWTATGSICGAQATPPAAAIRWLATEHRLPRARSRRRCLAIRRVIAARIPRRRGSRPLAPRRLLRPLQKAGRLRGCIGSIEARRPLALDAAANARAAATSDFRFPPVGPGELAEIEIHLSLLTAPEPLGVGSRGELLGALVPNADGLVLEEWGRRATFLPTVWTQLPDPESFVAHLERKAGLVAGSWSAARRAYRYRANRSNLGRSGFDRRAVELGRAVRARLPAAAVLVERRLAVELRS
jgi:AmmeMemoRadiSam system protein A